MSEAINRLLSIARGEGDIATTERDGATTYHTMTRPMSVAVDTAASGDASLSYLQSAGDPATEGFIDEATDTVITFPLRADVAHIGRDLAARREKAHGKKPPALWLVLLLGLAGAAQVVFALGGDVSILRIAVGIALIAGAVVLWRQRAVTPSRNP